MFEEDGSLIDLSGPGPGSEAVLESVVNDSESEPELFNCGPMLPGYLGLMLLGLLQIPHKTL